MGEFGITSDEAANILNVDTPQVQQLCRQGKLKAVKIGRMWFIDPASVQEYASKPRKPGPEKGQGGRPKKGKQ